MTHQPPTPRPDYTRHAVRVGRSLFWPRPSYWPLRAKEIVVQLVLEESAWWGLEEWEYDRDYYDWNKGAGVTSALWWNNYNAAFIGWRPLDRQPGTFEVCSYINDHRGNWKAGEITTVKAHQAVLMKVLLIHRNQIFTELITDGVRIQHSAPWRRPWYNLYRWSGLSIGGSDSTDSRHYGGRAHRTMRLWSKYDITRK